MFFILKNILVFFGGESIEHEISCITGVLTLNSVDKSTYIPIPVYVDGSGEWWTGENLFDVEFYKKVDYKKLDRVTLFSGGNLLYKVKGKKVKPMLSVSLAINCLHGERGEDGCLFGMLKMCKIPVLGSPLFASSLAMNKSYTKLALKGLRVKTLPYLLATDKDCAKEIQRKLKYPLIIKPDSGGSSIGISTANNLNDLQHALVVALRYGKTAIIEPKLTDFTEINCACFFADGKLVVSECERPVSRGDVLSFNDKYKSGERIFPADIDKVLSDKIKDITAKVYLNLGFSGVIRVDYLVSKGEVYLNEINSVPGSLSYYLFCKTTKEWGGVLNKLIAVALNEYARDLTVSRKFNSGILSLAGSKGAKRLKK